MRAGSFWRGIVAVLLTGLLFACTPPPPVELSTQFTPPHHAGWAASANWPGGHPTCRIRLVAVRDQRLDPQAMGDIGGRLVHASDARGWVQSGLLTLTLDPRIEFVDDTARSNLVLDVDLVNAYMLSITMDRSVSVVLRVRYSRQNKLQDEQVYRGVDTGTNWNSGREETQDAFDSALAQVIEDIDRDVGTRCGNG